MKLLIEAAVIGAALVVVQHVVCLLLQMLFGSGTINCPPILGDWGMMGVVFASGAVLHLTMELVGANKWYCKNGNACKV